MKKILVLLMMIFAVSGCGSVQDKPSSEPEKSQAVEKIPASTSSDKKILVVYFSRTGEEYNVGNITKGNTAIVADVIAKKIGADTFEIKPAESYPDNYQECTELAKRELESNVRPALTKNIDSLAQYDTIFLGYPIWWSHLPCVVMTFLESNDFSGKKIIPFCTHGGSGIAATEREISEACPKAEVTVGLAIVGKRCQDEPEKVQQDVNQWLQGLGY